MAKRKQFTFYESFHKALVKLPTEQAQQGAWAIVIYGLFGKRPDMELTPAADAVLEMAIPVLDSGRKKAEGAAEGNRTRKKKTEDSRIMPGCSPDNARIAPGYCPDMLREVEKEKENEVENEVEVEIEIEKELEKESLTHMGSVPLMCVRDEFDLFWDSYPLKLAKKQAWLAWKKVEPELDTVMSALSCWKRSRKWLAEEGRYIPRADKFLEEKHYEQPPKDAVPMGASGHLGKAEVEAIERLLNGNV